MTPHLHDARWRAAHAAHLRGDDPGVDPQWLREYQPRDPELAAERALFDALAQAEPGVEVDEDAAVAQALEQWGTEAHDIGPAPTRWVGRVAIAAGLVAAGLAAGLLLGWVGDTSPPDDTAPSLVRATKTPAPIEPSVAPAPAEATTPQSDPPAGWTVRSGQVVAEAVDEGNALPRGLALVAAGELCTASSPDREICLSDGARFEVEDDGELQLLEGRARVITRAEAVLAVTVDDVRVETQGASVYVVE
ncbi:MAG: hypothetical protein K0V04_03975, partial [Deltaproteobacteria bacterium]|nr:hypothetical protein [Deltaproteobacteria bacterium]